MSEGFSIATFGALFLDYRTRKFEVKHGKYGIAEDDKEEQRLNELKSVRARAAGYETPREQSTVSTGSGVAAWQEQDIGYHNRYGAEEQTHGPLEGDEQRDMGYHNQFFRN